MKTNNKSAVILSLDQNFGSLRLIEEDDQTIRFVGIDLMPGVETALAQLREHRLNTMLLLPAAPRVDEAENLTQFLPSVNAFMHIENDLQYSLKQSAAYLAAEPQSTTFVAADRVLRGQAVKMGFKAAAHPAIMALQASGLEMHFVRVVGERTCFDRLRETIPYHWENVSENRWRLLAVMSQPMIAELVTRQATIEVLPLDLMTEDPVFVHLDEMSKQLIARLTHQKILFSETHRALLALRPEDTGETVDIHGRHGHFLFLRPDMGLLEPSADADFAGHSAAIAISQLDLSHLEIIQITDPLAPTLLRPCPITPTLFQLDVNRYSGVSPLDAGGTVISRHIDHPDNLRVVNALKNDLKAMGYCAYTHSFQHAGRTLYNVIADLPGRGRFKLNIEVLEQLREIFIKYPLPDPPDPWLKLVEQTIGKRWFEVNDHCHMTALQLRRKLEDTFLLKPYYPWWRNLCLLPALSAEIIIVGCHLDSTAQSSTGYQPSTDPAPGADDNASGIAATLAMARSLASLKGKLKHNVRFCFFNAEEQGMVGSSTYASMLKAANAPIKAAVCMDMIGYNSDSARIFEIHAGYTDPLLRDKNVPIAQTIASWASALGVLAPAQIYKGTSASGGADRNLSDGAINRSDHASFHQQGYPAVVVSEDFFTNMSGEPLADPNPNYHRRTDTIIDSSFAADITCAINHAVKELANS